MKETLHETAMNRGATAKTGIIEIIGPPGAGKSTIYKALCNKWNANSGWTFPDALLPVEKSKSGYRSWLDYKLRKFIKRPVKTVPVNFGLQYIEQNKALADFLWNYVSSNSAFEFNDTGKRFRAIYFLFRDFCNYQALWKIKHSKPCIIDEGLLEKSFLAQTNRCDLEGLVQEYMALLPLPAAVIYVDTPGTDVIAERLLKRKKVIASHVGLNRDGLETDIANWQAYFSVVINQLKKNKIPVFFVDASKAVDENVRLINEFLKDR